MNRLSHIFDGKTLTKETAAFQLCDIEDPMLKGMIEDPEALRETCDVGFSFLSIKSIKLKLLIGERRMVCCPRVRPDQSCFAA